MLATVPEKVLDEHQEADPAAAASGGPDEIARVVHFLCADASSYITGQVLGRQRRHGHVASHPSGRAGAAGASPG